MRGMTRADFYFSLVLLALGIGVVVESLRMPRLEHLGINPYSVPGIVPGIIGVVLTLLAIILLVRSIGRIRRGAPGAETDPLSARRFALAAVLCLGYAAGLVGLIPFWLATFLFVTVFIWLFERVMSEGEPEGGAVRAAATAVIQGAVVAAAVTWVFREIFLVNLP